MRTRRPRSGSTEDDALIELLTTTQDNDENGGRERVTQGKAGDVTGNVDASWK